MKSTKRLISVVLTLVLILQVGVVAFAATTSSWVLEDDTVVCEIRSKADKTATLYYIKNQDYTGRDLVIPKEVDGYKIVDINCYRFDELLELGRVYSPKEGSSVDTVYDGTGGYIETVKSIVIEAELGDVISENYSYYEEEPYDFGLFEKFVNLESITLPDDLKKIDLNAFKNCENLKTVKLPANLVSISHGAFENCKSLENITFNDSLETIGYDAFANCTSLKNVTFNEKLESIGSRAFYNCTGLTDIVLNENLGSIYNSAFENCVNLKSIDGNDDAKIEFNDGLKTISSSAFENCNSLKGKVYLGKNVSEVEDAAFAGANGITGFRIDEENENLSEQSGVLYNKDKTKLICYLSGKGTKTWTVPSSVNKIEKSAFAKTENLKKITLPSNIKEAPNRAFENSAIESINAKGVVTIGYETFKNCENLKKIEFSPKLEKIGDSAFEGCKNLSGKFKIGKDVESIYSSTFLGCDSLTGFVVEDGNKYFSQKSGVLYNKDKTELIFYLPRKATKNFAIPSTVTSIAVGAFQGAKYIEKVTIPSRIREIPYLCFAESNISDVKIEPGRETLTIGSYAFFDCDNLKSITIPDRGKELWENDTKYYDFDYGSGGLIIHLSAFWNCDNLTKIVLMNSDADFRGTYPEDRDYMDGSLNEKLVFYYGEKRSTNREYA